MNAAHLVDLTGMMRLQWRSRAEIESVQRRRLRALVEHAYRKVPYYRDMFDSLRLKPSDIRRAEDLAALPITTKAQLKALPLHERAASGVDLDRCKRSLTSGTTGVPLEIYFSRDDWTRLNLGVARAFMACGMRPWHRMTSFVGRRDVHKKRSWYEYLGMWRGQDLSSWASADEWIASIRRWKPRALVGYVVTLRLLAEAVRREGIRDIRPSLVISGSGVIDEFTRRLIDSTFGCRVADFYGSFEAGAIAWQCDRCRDYHISVDTVVLEVLRGGRPVKPGEEGEAVITNLFSHTMPFIRYLQDDVVVRSPRSPACGRQLPLLERVVGRTDDFITLRSGRRIPSQPFYYSIEPAPGIRRWRVVQESLATLRVDIETEPTFGPRSREIIEENLRAVVGDEMELKIVLTQSLSVPPGMKFRQVSSLLTAAAVPGATTGGGTGDA